MSLQKQERKLQLPHHSCRLLDMPTSCLAGTDRLGMGTHLEEVKETPVFHKLGVDIIQLCHTHSCSLSHIWVIILPKCTPHLHPRRITRACIPLRDETKEDGYQHCAIDTRDDLAHLQTPLQWVAKVLCDLVDPDAAHCPDSQGANQGVWVLRVL